MRAILTYHSVDEAGSVISISPEVLRRHVRWLDESGVTVVGVEELLALPETADAVALTFDDAFENFATTAWPLLRERGYPVTLFVPTDHVGGSNVWEPGEGKASGRPLLGWDALRDLVREGVTLGAHSATHPRLRGLTGTALEREVTGAADRLQAEMGVRPRAYAYPYGEFDADVKAAVAAAYTVACTTEFRLLRSSEDAHLLPRLDAWYFRRPGTLEGWGGRVFRRYIGMRGKLRKARRLLVGGKGS